MQTNQQSLIDHLTQELAGSSPIERARLLAELTRAVYDHAKYTRGSTRTTMERIALSKIYETVEDYHLDFEEALRAAGDAEPGPSRRRNDVLALTNALFTIAENDFQDVEFVLSAPAQVTDQIPVHSEVLVRSLPTGPGDYHGHVYRDTMVETIPAGADTVRSNQIVLSPLLDGPGRPSANAPTLVGDLETGQIWLEGPAVGDESFTERDARALLAARLPDLELDFGPRGRPAVVIPVEDAPHGRDPGEQWAPVHTPSGLFVVYTDGAVYQYQASGWVQVA